MTVPTYLIFIITLSALSKNRWLNSPPHWKNNVVSKTSSEILDKSYYIVNVTTKVTATSYYILSAQPTLRTYNGKAALLCDI